MGFFIEQTPKGRLPVIGKAEFLKENYDAVVTDDTFKENLVCVVLNGEGDIRTFDAAGYMFDEAELKRAQPRYPYDMRERIWLIVPEAAELSGYNNYIKTRDAHERTTKGQL